MPLRTEPASEQCLSAPSSVLHQQNLLFQYLNPKQTLRIRVPEHDKGTSVPIHVGITAMLNPCDFRCKRRFGQNVVKNFQQFTPRWHDLQRVKIIAMTHRAVGCKLRLAKPASMLCTCVSYYYVIDILSYKPTQVPVGTVLVHNGRARVPQTS